MIGPEYIRIYHLGTVLSLQATVKRSRYSWVHPHHKGNFDNRDVRVISVQSWRIYIHIENVLCIFWLFGAQTESKHAHRSSLSRSPSFMHSFEFNIYRSGICLYLAFVKCSFSFVWQAIAFILIMKIPTKATKTRSTTFFFSNSSLNCCWLCVWAHNANVFRSFVVYRRLVGLPEFDRLLNIDTLNDFSGNTLWLIFSWFPSKKMWQQFKWKVTKPMKRKREI